MASGTPQIFFVQVVELAAGCVEQKIGPILVVVEGAANDGGVNCVALSTGTIGALRRISMCIDGHVFSLFCCCDGEITHHSFTPSVMEEEEQEEEEEEETALDFTACFAFAVDSLAPNSLSILRC